MKRTSAYLDYVTPADVVAALTARKTRTHRPDRPMRSPSPRAASTSTTTSAPAITAVPTPASSSRGSDSRSTSMGTRSMWCSAVMAAPMIATCTTICRSRRPNRLCPNTRFISPTPPHRGERLLRNALRPWDPKFLNGLANLQALVASSTAGEEVDMVNNNLKVPYSDQFSIGIRNKVGDWNTSAAVARILSKDGFAFTLGNRSPTGAFFVNGGSALAMACPASVR